MRRIRTSWWKIASVSLWALLLSQAPAAAEDSASPDVPPASAPERARIAVLPLANHTESTVADTVVLALLRHEIARHGFVEIPADRMRSVLRARRIRTQGSIGRAAAVALRDEIAVDYFLLGSIDFWKDEENPEVGISLRMLGGEEPRILGAASAGGTGADFAGLFGVGRIDSIRPLAERVVKRVVRSLIEDVRPLGPEKELERSPVLVVPFDNASDNPRAGDIATGIMISALQDAGYQVIEPGFAQEVFFALKTSPRGRIDQASALAAQAALAPGLFVTGEIQGFRPARGMDGESPPSLELGVRVLDGETGDFLLSYDREKTDPGSGEALLRGHRGSLTELTLATFQEVLREVRGDLEDRAKRAARRAERAARPGGDGESP